MAASIGVVQPAHGTITVEQGLRDAFRVRYNPESGYSLTEFRVYCYACQRTLLSSSSNPATFNITSLESQAHPGPFEITAVITGSGPGPHPTYRYEIYLKTESVPENAGTTNYPSLTLIDRRESGFSTTVTLTCEPNIGYVFDYWSVMKTDGWFTPTIYRDKTANVNVTLWDEHTHSWANNVSYRCRAVFKAAELYEIIIDVCNGMEGRGSTTPPGGKYYERESMSISATANEGYYFAGWSSDKDDPTKIIKKERIFTLTVDNDYEFYAVYNRIEILSKRSADGTAGGGTIDGYDPTKQYAYDDELNLTAVAADGFRFLTWSDGVTDATRTIKLMGDLSLTAFFCSDMLMYDPSSGALLYAGNPLLFDGAIHVPPFE